MIAVVLRVALLVLVFVMSLRIVTTLPDGRRWWHGVAFVVVLLVPVGFTAVVLAALEGVQ